MVVYQLRLWVYCKLNHTGCKFTSTFHKAVLHLGLRRAEMSTYKTWTIAMYSVIASYVTYNHLLKVVAKQQKAQDRIVQALVHKSDDKIYTESKKHVHWNGTGLKTFQIDSHSRFLTKIGKPNKSLGLLYSAAGTWMHCTVHLKTLHSHTLGSKCNW